MVQIITWNKDDTHIEATDPQGIVHDLVYHMRNVVIWMFPDNYNIIRGDTKPSMAEVRDENNNLVEYIGDIQKDNTFHYQNVSEPPSAYAGYKFCYTDADGWYLKPPDSDPTGE